MSDMNRRVLVAASLAELGVGNPVLACFSGLSLGIPCSAAGAEQIAGAERDWLMGSHTDLRRNVVDAYSASVTAAGRASNAFLPPSAKLEQILLKRGHLPRINAFVDAYNVVSLKTGLSIGAHDEGNVGSRVLFRPTVEGEPIMPVGSSRAIRARPGEWAYADEHRILALLDTIDSDAAKITESTTTAFCVMQGNASTSVEYRRQAMYEVLALVQSAGQEGAAVNFLSWEPFDS